MSALIVPKPRVRVFRYAVSMRLKKPFEVSIVNHDVEASIRRFPTRVKAELFAKRLRAVLTS